MHTKIVRELSTLYAAQCTLLLLSSLNILKHRKRFISKYDTLICKWICPHTYIHHNHSRWKPPFAMRVSTEDSKMDGRCNVKASEIRVSIVTLRYVASRANELASHAYNISQMISQIIQSFVQLLSSSYSSRRRFYSKLRFGNLWKISFNN